MIEIYTDGSCRGNGKKHNVGGYGYAILENDILIASGGKGEKDTTNNRMEMLAIIESYNILKQKELNQNTDIIFITDSSYVVNCLYQKWYHKWLTNNWINSKNEPVKNKDLWKSIIPLFEDKRITFRWVKGHNGNNWNEYVDKIAVKNAEDLK